MHSDTENRDSLLSIIQQSPNYGHHFVLDAGGNGFPVIIIKTTKNTYLLHNLNTITPIPLPKVQELFKMYWFTSYYEDFINHPV